MKTIYLIRHAESMGNAGYKTPNTEENPLSEKGLAQAKELAKRLLPLCNLNFLVVHSSYKRSWQTAKEFIYLSGIDQSREWPVHEFTYLSAAKYANSSFDERLPAKKEYWQMLDPDYHDDDAESYNDFFNRIAGTLEDIKSSSYPTLFIFSHQEFIKGLLLSILVKQLEGAVPNMNSFHNFSQSFHIPNTAILKLLFDGKNFAISPFNGVPV